MAFNSQEIIQDIRAEFEHLPSVTIMMRQLFPII